MGLAVKTRNFAPTGPNFIWIRERKLMATALDGRIVTKKKKQWKTENRIHTAQLRLKLQIQVGAWISYKFNRDPGAERAIEGLGKLPTQPWMMGSSCSREMKTWRHRTRIPDLLHRESIGAQISGTRQGAQRCTDTETPHTVAWFSTNVQIFSVEK